MLVHISESVRVSVIFHHFVYRKSDDTEIIVIIHAVLQKSEAAAVEKSRATAAAMNAEIRRTKAPLLEEWPKLHRLAFKKVKGISKEELEARGDLVTVLKDKREAIPDGSSTAARQTSGWAPSSSHAGIKIDSTDGSRLDAIA